MSPLPGLLLRPPSLLAPVASGVSYGVAAGVRGAADVAGRLMGLPKRGVWWRTGRCYIKVNGARGADGDRLVRHVERTLEEHPGVVWARVNAPSERVVVAVTSPPPPERELIALVDRAEAEVGARADEFDEWCTEPQHPCEGPSTRQTVPALAADTVGLALTAVRQLAPWIRLPPEVAALAGALKYHPRLRHLVAAVGGTEQAESFLPVVNALAQGVATRGGGIALDVLERIAQWREATAEREAWDEAEPRLVRGPDDASAEPLVIDRAGPTPKDTTDRYAERAMAAGLTAGALTVPFAGPRRAIAVALSAVPKAPEAGREGFASHLGRALALRGVVTMDRGALRRLGQVDTVVLDEDALRGDRYEPVDLELLSGADPEGTAERLFALFDADSPLRTVRDDEGWTLGPLAELDLTGRTGRQAEARLRRRGSERILGLAHGRRLQAVAGLATQTAPGAEAVAAAARRAGARVVLATDRDTPAFTFADAVVPAGDRLVASVRGLQADGAVILLVSGNRRALGVADCGVGVHGEGEHPAWGAHLIVGADLEAAGLIVDAVGVAARVDRDSDVLAATGSGVGAVAALRAPRPQATARTMAVGNSAGSLAFCLGNWRARQLLARPLAPPVTSVPWHLMPTDRVLRRLRTTADGLTSEEAAARVGPGTNGSGTAEPARLTLPSAFIEELANPLTPVLAGGAALAAAVGSRTDATLVAAITGSSALIGGFQRVRTERALAELFARSAIGARVRRAGRERLVTAGELVEGDVILLRPEDVVPADCRLLEAEGLEVDESSLTGESLAVGKDVAPVVATHITGRRSMVYEGTTVSAGRAVAVVVATGSNTEVGRSLATARQAAPETGVEARLASLTRTSLPIAIGSAGAVAVSGLLHGRPLSDNLASAVNLAVASVPEGLPFLVNAAQLAAARRLADVGALVRNPRTIEALGRADVLCFDKTGTLTEGKLQLWGVSDGSDGGDAATGGGVHAAAGGSGDKATGKGAGAGADKATGEGDETAGRGSDETTGRGGALPLDRLDTARKEVLAAALRATPPARQAEPMAHQTDRAVTAGARSAKVTARQGAARWRRLDTLPFEPSRAYHATSGATTHGLLLSVKGAPENVLERCSRRRRPGDGRDAALDAEGRGRLTAEAERLAGAGRRVLAVAERRMGADEDLTDDSVRDLVFLGFLTLADPVRASAAPATARLREAGVQTVMITGDHPATADAIASTISDITDPKVCTGAELDELDDAGLDELLPTVDVIARCSPHHKVRIVQAYQRIGRVVAMTGDGANDAPAIRLADIGIALGRRGTPAATAAADLVVGDDRLETIVSALMEGRAMWASVRTALGILIGGNLGEVTFSVLISALTGTTPLNARQIMLVNLLTDLAPSLAIAVREPTRQTGERLLEEGPRRSLGTALTNEMLLRGVITATGAALAWGAARLTGRGRRAATVSLAAVVGTQLAQTLATGGLDWHVVAASLGSAAVLAAIIQTPGVSQFFGCTPLGPIAWSIALGAIAAAMLLGTVGSPLLTRAVARASGALGGVSDTLGGVSGALRTAVAAP
ncbi:cation-transporting P-type ATPase [Streptomyces sp. HC44]|uniref:Cation-transporting P-type ATPase n=1 Tax=Streptomyces scabichelini TaxID=2711217 RepID=A0A6G4VAY7_9ACTN|nr:cation-transporting P-type ATPase [Streptomyces scabichelini]NGO11249.1 cation-transporting P-type ATPase [Streptomyces scabichelini]